MSSDLLKLAYAAGQAHALRLLLGKQAAEDATHLPPDDASVALPIGGGNPSSSDFATFAQRDSENRGADRPQPSGFNVPEKPVHWSGHTSLDGGDAGTRTMNMGLPRFGGV